MLEKIIANQISSFFERNELFSRNQYGFRAAHCTEHAAIELTDRIITKMDNNEIPIGIFLDLSKAFDTINHKILLSKLKYYGISGVPLQLLDNYLTNRSQYVVIKNIKSNTLQITTGVPQGFILGPLLFLIYINDFSQSSLAFNFISYADDTTLLSTLGNFNNTGSDVERDNLINA